MFNQLKTKEEKQQYMARLTKAALLLALTLTFAIGAAAQGGAGDLSGVVYDQTGAIIPKAKGTLTNEATGVVLVADGFGQHVSKGYIYFAMAFSLFVEILNIRIRGRKTAPVHLHQSYVDEGAAKG